MEKTMFQAFSQIILPPGSTSVHLQSAIDNAALGDSIILSGDMPFSEAVTLPAGKEITIQSDAGNNWKLTQTNAQIRHFLIESALTLQDITLDGGTVGGGIQVNSGANLILQNGASVTNCYNSGHGGGIYANNGNVIVDGGSIMQNVSGDSGGGIYATGTNASVELLAGSIHYNNAKSMGGGAFVSNMKMRGGSVNYNYTDGGSGGGMYAMAPLEMTDGEIAYNEVKPASGQSTASGGGLYCSGTLSAPVTIRGGKIHHNKIDATPGGSRGGGICVFRGVKFYLRDAEIYENEATWGGGIFFDAYMQYGIPQENTVITGNTFIHDNRGTQGGGICFYNNVPGDPDIGLLGMAPQINENVKITNNTASNGGGILFYPFLGASTRTQVMMHATISGNVEISENKATTRGAGILMQDDSKEKGVIAALTLNGHVIVRGNEVTADTGMGGGIYTANSTFTLSESTVSGNSASSGGGLFINKTAFSMESSSVSNNTAKDGNGAGIYLRGSENTTIHNNCVIADNQAPNGDGGGIFTEDSENYANLMSDGSTVFRCNRAQAAYHPPEDAVLLYPHIQFAETSITEHPLNNFDVYYTESEPIAVAFHVTYHANGGDGSHAGPDVAAGAADTVLSLDETEINRAGYTLASWNTQADGSGTAYLPGNTILVNCNVTLYAQWVAVESYTVIYDCNGGNGGYVDPGREYAVYYTILSPNQTGISRTGFLFSSWNTQQDGSGIFRMPGERILIAENLRLYAQWRQIPAQKQLCRAPATISRRAVEGQVLWVDNDNAGNTRPSSVEIILLRDGEAYKRANVDATGDGYFGFCCLPVCKNAAHSYRYQIEESAVSGYITVVAGYTVINTLAP